MRRTVLGWSLLLAIFSRAICASATAIVYVKFEGGYAVGADSLLIGQDAQGNAVVRTKACKLLVDREVVFASSGIYRVEGSPGIEELSRPVRLAVSGSADTRNDVLFKILMHNKAFLDGVKSTKNPAVTWVFVDSNDAAEGIINFFLGVFKPDPGGFDDAFGWPNHIYPYLGKLLIGRPQPNSLPTRDEAVDIVRQTIQEGIRKDPWIIGGKISLLTVDKAGVQWIDRGECAIHSKAPKTYTKSK